MKVSDRLLRRAEKAYTAFFAKVGQFRDGPASPTPHRLGIVAFGIPIEGMEAWELIEDIRLARQAIRDAHKKGKARR